MKKKGGQFNGFLKTAFCRVFQGGLGRAYSRRHKGLISVLKKSRGSAGGAAALIFDLRRVLHALWNLFFCLPPLLGSSRGADPTPGTDNSNTSSRFHWM